MENSKSEAYIDILTDIIEEQRDMTDEELAIYRKILYQGTEQYSLTDNKKFLVKDKDNKNTKNI